MARLPRLYVAGCAQHIIQRGNNRSVCFFEQTDYAVYLNKLKEYSDKYGVEIHAFVLMSNHVHLLATPSGSTSISDMMQSLGRYYVRYVNSRYQRTGTLWEGRFRSTLVGSEEYLLRVYRYIELNPVRAAMVDEAADYIWSSFHSNALGKQIELITPHSCYLSLGSSASERLAIYQALFKECISDKAMDEIRHSTNKGWVLGSEYFKRKIEIAANRRMVSLGLGGDRKSEAYRERF